MSYSNGITMKIIVALMTMHASRFNEATQQPDGFCWPIKGFILKCSTQQETPSRQAFTLETCHPHHCSLSQLCQACCQPIDCGPVLTSQTRSHCCCWPRHQPSHGHTTSPLWVQQVPLRSARASMRLITSSWIVGSTMAFKLSSVVVWVISHTNWL